MGRQRGATVRAHPGPRVVPAGHTEHVSTAIQSTDITLSAYNITLPTAIASTHTHPAHKPLSAKDHRLPAARSRTQHTNRVQYGTHHTPCLINTARPSALLPPPPPAATDPCRVAWCLSLLPSLVVRGRLGTEPERSRPGVVAPGIVFTDVWDELLAVGRRNDGQWEAGGTMERTAETRSVKWELQDVSSITLHIVIRAGTVGELN